MLEDLFIVLLSIFMCIYSLIKKEWVLLGASIIILIFGITKFVEDIHIYFFKTHERL